MISFEERQTEKGAEYRIVAKKGLKSIDPVSIVYRSNFDTRLVLEANSEMTFIEELLSDDLNVSGQIDIELGEGAKLLWISTQALSQKSAFQIQQNLVALKNSSVEVRQIQLGGAKGAIQLNATAEGKGASISVFAASRTEGSQSLNYNVEIKHMAEYTQSKVEYLTVAGGESQIGFEGNLIITETALHSEAVQTNKNLLASPFATVNAFPKLEIATDEVKCAHGSSTSSIAEESLYYLMSRGISNEESVRMIVDGFTQSTLDGIPSEHLRDKLRTEFEAKKL